MERIREAWRQLAELRAGQEALLWGLFLTCVVQEQTESQALQHWAEIIGSAA